MKYNKSIVFLLIILISIVVLIVIKNRNQDRYILLNLSGKEIVGISIEISGKSYVHRNVLADMKIINNYSVNSESSISVNGKFSNNEGIINGTFGYVVSDLHQNTIIIVVKNDGSILGFIE